MALRLIVRPSRCGFGFLSSTNSLKTQKMLVAKDAAQDTAHVKTFDEIPGPKGLPLIGTMLDYARNDGISRMHEIMAERIQTYGPIVREDMLNFKCVYVSDVNDVEHVFRNEGKNPVREPQLPIWNKYKKDRDQQHGIFTL